MNNLQALIIVRGAARVSVQMRSRQGITAGKVVDRKIQSLLRKKAWRDGGGAVPVHMGSDDFRYDIPDDPVTAALRGLVQAEDATRATGAEIAQLEAALKQAREVLSSLENKNNELRLVQTSL